MAYFPESELRSLARDSRFTKFANLKESRASAEISIFLSHSHKDKDLVLGLLAYFEKLGVTIYVDWNDSEMPRITSRVTADQIKRKIKEHPLFMILATQNALDSKWVPWEVGVADQCKPETNIIVVPVSDDSGRFEGAEYLQLYRQVKEAAGGQKGILFPTATEGSKLTGYLQIMVKSAS